MRICLLFVVIFSYLPMAFADERPLHQEIDAQFGFADGAVCSDADFLRRSSLDLTGIPPTTQEAREFLADTRENKRALLIEKLLDSPHHVRHLATFLDVTLMERRAASNVPQDQWMAWLYESVRANKPWNVLAREILIADGDEPQQRAPARFALDRGAEPNLLTRDISRIFFGRDIQCAQCHDHPSVSDFLQSDYQGLLAIVSCGYAVPIKKGDATVTVYAERAGSDVKFESVFIKGVPHRTGPRVPGSIVLEEPFFLPGEEYIVPVSDGVKSVPKFSRRAQLAELATNGQNRLFNENIVNRLWAMLFGQGLYHPLDMNHPDNPAVNVPLLAMLAERFPAMNYDMRAFLKELALSQVYQRPFDPPTDYLSEADRLAAERESLAQQRAELQALAEAAKEQYAQAGQVWHDSEKEMLPAVAALDTAVAGCAEARKQLVEVQTAMNTASASLTEKQNVHPAVKAAADAAAAAIAQLPNDQELAAAAQKFAERNQQLTTDIGNLQKVVEESNGKLPTLTVNFDTTKQSVETSKTVAEQLRNNWRKQEEVLLAARNKMVAEASRLEAVSRQANTLKQVSELNELTVRLRADQQNMTEKSAALAAARQQIADLSQQMNTLTQEFAAATAARNATLATLEAAELNLKQHQGLLENVLAAFQKIEVARSQAPDDATLADVASTLKTKVEMLQAHLLEPQQVVEIAQGGMKAAQTKMESMQPAMQAVQAELTRAEGLVGELENQVAQLQQSVATTQTALASAAEKVTERLSQAGRLASLKPLTPEQMCWAIFRATGGYERTWVAEAAALEQAAPLTPEQLQNPELVRNRQFEIEQKTYDKLKGSVATFVQFYATGPGEPQGDFFATVDQALYVTNGADLNSWVAPLEGNVAERALKASEPAQTADELYLTTLSRYPTEEERMLVANHMAPRQADRDAAVKELLWGLITSAEFRFNH